MYSIFPSFKINVLQKRNAHTALNQLNSKIKVHMMQRGIMQNIWNMGKFWQYELKFHSFHRGMSYIECSVRICTVKVQFVLSETVTFAARWWVHFHLWKTLNLATATQCPIWSIPKRRVSDGFGGCIQTWEAPTGIHRKKRENQCCVYYKTDVLKKIMVPALHELWGPSQF